MNSSEVKSDSEAEPLSRIVLALCSIGYIEKKCLDSIIMSYGAFSNFISISGTLLPWTRNFAINEIFRQNDEFTHVLFVDDDMCNFSAQHINLLLEADKDIVSAITVSRRPPYKIVNCFPDPTQITTYIKNQAIIESKHVGMAFTLIKREVFEVTKEYVPDIQEHVWFTTDRMERPEFTEECNDFIKKQLDSNEKPNRNMILEAIAFGQNSHLGTPLFGEDVGFCMRAEKFGFKAWTHCGVPVAHIGNNPHDWEDAIRNNPPGSLNLVTA